MGDEALIQGVSWLTSLLNLQGLTATVTAEQISDGGGDSCWLTINHRDLSSEQIQSLIGESGVVLDAIQYLANTTLNLGKGDGQQQAFTIDLAGYRAQRLQELQALAQEAAQQVLSTGQEYELKGLSSAERRQIHQFLSEQSGLSTFSRGKEPDRRLVVCLTSTD
ncbi:MAG: RNA-binding protein [Cyanobacteria bacterium REEB459]|nr:RNA-binding protein [Cyanobacteria bacterium REEB459]